MAEFRSLNSLFSYLEKQLQQSLEQVAEDVQQMMHDYIQTNLYDAYQPKQYVRTYDYLNSLSVKPVKKENGWNVVEIYFDPEKIHQNEVDGYWNQHMSVYGHKEWHGKSVSEWIPIWMNEGVHDSTIFNREGIDVTGNIIRELESTKFHLNKIIDLLHKKGIKAQVKGVI